MNNTIEINKNSELNKIEEKREYKKPILKKYGKVAKMTKGGSGPEDDGFDIAHP